MDKDKKKEFQCEIKDLMQGLQRFSGANNKNVAFVGALIAFDDKGQTVMKKDTGVMFAFGDLLVLRNMLFDLRNKVDDLANDDDFVDM